MTIDRDAMRAAFNAGWAAACMTLAEACEKGGQREQGRLLRKMAGQPAPVEIGLASEGDSHPDGNEVVMMETVRRGKGRS